MTKLNKARFKLPRILSIGIGIATSVVVMLLLSALLAISILNEYLNINMIPYYVAAIWAISAFCGSYLTCKIGESSDVTWAIFTVGGCFLLLAAIALLFYDGFTSGFFACLAGCVAGGVLSILLCNRPKKPAYRKARRGRSR